LSKLAHILTELFLYILEHNVGFRHYNFETSQIRTTLPHMLPTTLPPPVEKSNVNCTTYFVPHWYYILCPLPN